MQDSYILYKTLGHKITEVAILSDALVQGDLSWQAMREGLAKIALDCRSLSGALTKKEVLIDRIEKALHLSMLNQTLSTIKQAQSSNSLGSIKRLIRNYLNDMQSFIEDYGQKATNVQLEGLNGLLSSWLLERNLSPALSTTLVVGPAGPREGMIEMQLFEWFYARNGISSAIQDDKLVYVQSPIEQLATIRIEELIHDHGRLLLNKAIGLSVLGDENAMKNDILKRHAPKVLGGLDLVLSCPFKV